VATMTATVPTLSACCVCKHVAEPVSSSIHWTPMATYLERHQLRLSDVRLSHTYCPVCYERQARAWSLPVIKPSVRMTRRAA
jgi:uncharacterized protein (UPF0212 family)